MTPEDHVAQGLAKLITAVSTPTPEERAKSIAGSEPLATPSSYQRLYGRALEQIREAVAAERERCAQEIRIVFDGPPSHESGRFVEVEDAGGKSISCGDWHQRPDGLWELRFQVWRQK